jgi:hypothetical protein
MVGVVLPGGALAHHGEYLDERREERTRRMIVPQHGDRTLADGAPNGARRIREVAEECRQQLGDLGAIEVVDERLGDLVDGDAHRFQQRLVRLGLCRVVDELLRQRRRVLATLARLNELRNLGELRQRRALRSRRRIARLDRLRAQLDAAIDLPNDALRLRTNQNLAARQQENGDRDYYEIGSNSRKLQCAQHDWNRLDGSNTAP